nr:hypothetical protein GCM10020093_089880 [Planobispora longispora]
MSEVSRGSLSLDVLRTFLAVYRSGSVTGAAHVLRMSQPAVSAQIKALETTLDRRLFERLPRGVAPTAAADELARRLAAPSTCWRRRSVRTSTRTPRPARCTWAVPPS